MSGSLFPQTKPANEILVGIRADDHSNDEALKKYRERLAVRSVEAKGVGVVGSMNSCYAKRAATILRFWMMTSNCHPIGLSEW